MLSIVYGPVTLTPLNIDRQSPKVTRELVMGIPRRRYSEGFAHADLSTVAELVFIQSHPLQ
jgi:hypothetical protein